MKLIDKDSVVAEIEKRKQEEVDYDGDGNFASYVDNIHHSTLDSIQDFIDTLEVQEVDLIKEVANWKIDHQVYGMDETFYDIAKHFFELGLAQKGE